LNWSIGSRRAIRMERPRQPNTPSDALGTDRQAYLLFPACDFEGK
jgi:hypothetical protein